MKKSKIVNKIKVYSNKQKGSDSIKVFSNLKTEIFQKKYPYKIEFIGTCENSKKRSYFFKSHDCFYVLSCIQEAYGLELKDEKLSEINNKVLEEYDICAYTTENNILYHNKLDEVVEEYFLEYDKRYKLKNNMDDYIDLDRMRIITSGVIESGSEVKPQAIKTIIPVRFCIKSMFIDKCYPLDQIIKEQSRCKDSNEDIDKDNCDEISF